VALQANARDTCKLKARPSVARRKSHQIISTTSIAVVIALGALVVTSVVDVAPVAAVVSAGAASPTAAASPAVGPPTTAAATTQQDWTLLKSPTPTDALLIGSTCVDAWDCWSVGGTLGNGNDQNDFRGVADHWNGTAWSSISTPRPGNLGWLFTSVSCAQADDCWAVGAQLNDGSPPEPLSEHWNGSTWSIAPVGSVSGYLLGVSCPSASVCWAVGPRSNINGDALSTLVERWNGSSWSEVAFPKVGQKYSDLESVTCTGTSECLAVGWDGPDPQTGGFLPVFPDEAHGQALIGSLNGSSWSTVASPRAADGSYLSSVTCVGSADCWAVGSLTDTAGFAASALVDHWDGTSWRSSAISGFPDPTGDFLRQVTCLNASYCLAAGSSGLENGFGGGVEPAAAVWNGSEWSGTSVTGSYVIGMSGGIACAGRARCFISGFTLNPDNNGLNSFTLLEQLVLSPGYRLTASDGGVFNFGSDEFHGSATGLALNAPIVGVTSPDTQGYWLVGSDGGVFSFGEATFQGSMAGTHLNAPVVGIATHDDSGYWLVGADGGVFSFGDTTFYGSMGGHKLAAPVVGITASQDGKGYWLVGSDGGVFCYGDAMFHGSMAGRRLAAPIVGIAATPDGGGYWLVGADGGVFSFGDATFYGSMAGHKLAAPVVGITASQDGKGYWLVGSDGGVFSFGDASFLGSEAGERIALPVVAGA
jgi:hypothetical protein